MWLNLFKIIEIEWYSRYLQCIERCRHDFNKGQIERNGPVTFRKVIAVIFRNCRFLNVKYVARQIRTLKVTGITSYGIYPQIITLGNYVHIIAIKLCHELYLNDFYNFALLGLVCTPKNTLFLSLLPSSPVAVKLT